MLPTSGGMTIAASRFMVCRSPTTEPWRKGPTAFACTENIIGWTTPSSQPRKACAAKSSAKMPPKKGVAEISRIDDTVPLSIVRCGSPSRIARPAKSEPRPLVIWIAANRIPIDVPVSPIPFKIDDVDRALHAIGGGAQKMDGHRRRHCRDRDHRKTPYIVRQSGEHVDDAQPRAPARTTAVAREHRRLGGAEQRQGQRRTPGTAERVGGPGAAEIPRRPGNHGRHS